MMKKVFSVVLTAMIAVAAHAEVLDPAQALARVNATPQMSSRAAGVSATPLRTIMMDAQPALYVFQQNNGGMMLVSAESETIPVLGYADSYDAEGTIPPALEMMMQSYAEEIASVRALKVQPRTSAGYDDFTAIAPICTTKWNQNAPYNADCPTYSGYACYTGCVATAMAQVLRVYEYPEKCSGGIDYYTWETGGKSLIMNFDVVEFDWSAMADSYSSDEEAPEVAKLMKAIGYASKMEYSPYGSGTYAQYLAMGLVKHFGFDNTLSYEMREWFTLDEWHQKVYAELAAGHPVYYDGVTPDYVYGHGFVIDGYSSNGFFHVNWGWGGMSDGYFQLTVLDPATQGIGGSSSGYSVSQGALFGLTPATTAEADAPYQYVLWGKMTAAVTSASLGEAVKFNASSAVQNVGVLSSAKVSPAMKITNAEGVSTYVADETVYTNYDVLYGYYTSFSVTFPTNLADGDYELAPAVYNPDTEKFYDVKYTMWAGGVVPATVSGTTISFKDPTLSHLQSSNVTLDTTIYQDTPFEFSATVENVSTVPYYDAVWLMLCKSGTLNGVAIVGGFPVNLEAGESVEISTIIEQEGSTPDAGTYDLYLVDTNYYILDNNPIEVTVSEAPTAGTPWVLSMSCTNKAQNNLTFDTNIFSNGGLYAEHLYLIMYSGKEYVTVYECPTVILPNGVTKEVELTINFSEGVVGQTYTAYVGYWDGSAINYASGTNSVEFVLAEAEDAVEDSIEEVDATVAPAEYYDLSGRRVDSPKNGLFIRRQGTTVNKICL